MRLALVVPLAAALLGSLPPHLAAQRLRVSAPLADLRARAQADSNDAAAHYFLALGLWSAGDFLAAESELRLAVQIDPRLAEGYLALAYLPYARRPKLWEEQGRRDVADSLRAQVDESDRQYRRAFLVNPLVDLRIVGAAAPPPAFMTFASPAEHDVYDYLFKGFDDLAEGNYQSAFERIDRVITDFWGRRDLRRVPTGFLFNRGLAAAHVEKYAEAIRDFQLLYDRARRQERTDSLIRVPLRTNEYRYMLAYVMQRAGQVDSAIALYEEAMQNDIGLYMGLVQLADLYESKQMWQEAVRTRQSAVNANPDDPSLLIDFGILLFKLGQVDAAGQVLTQAIDLNPRDVRGFYLYGIVAQRQNKPAEARDAFTRFIAAAPSRFERQVADARRRLESLPN